MLFLYVKFVAALSRCDKDLRPINPFAAWPFIEKFANPAINEINEDWRIKRTESRPFWIELQEWPF